MNEYKGYLIDLDGTMYMGTKKIEAAGRFIERLNEKNIPYLFVTNNSSRKPEQVASKLNDFDIPTTPEKVFTTSMATANFIAEQKKDASVYYIGEEGLHFALTEKGLTIDEENPDYVVVGIDREITYEKFAKACLAVRNGATFISTNKDVSIPTERGFLPGNGSLTAVVRVSTGVQPLFIGKPENIIMLQALEAMGLQKHETIMVGDNYDTDIMAGINAGIDTLLVHSGVTTKEKLTGYEKQPTYVVDSLDEWKV
jgi:4-nitrophenyl phosphatase